MLRPFGVRKYNKEFQDDFPLEKSNGYYQIDTSDDHQIRTPNNNAFTGNIYLLISPAVASAGSLFAAMVAGNANTITIGEETMGGYYGHNGHTSIDYKLPKSKIEFSFSVVNLEQDVPKKENQAYNRGIMPDHIVHQSFKDYLAQKDTQLNFTLELIKKNTVEWWALNSKYLLDLHRVRFASWLSCLRYLEWIGLVTNPMTTGLLWI